MEKISKEAFLEECKKLLDYFGVDYSAEILKMTDGGNSCIMNKTSQFYELFGGLSINSVIKYVAEQLGKKCYYQSEKYGDPDDDEELDEEENKE